MASIGLHGHPEVQHMYSDWSKIPEIFALETKYASNLKKLNGDLIRALVKVGTIEELQVAIAHGYPLYLPKIDKFWGRRDPGITGYHDAAKLGEFSKFMCLVKAGMPIDLRDSSGLTAVHYACSIPEKEYYSIEGKIAILEYLNGKIPFVSKTSSSDGEIESPIYQIVGEYGNVQDPTSIRTIIRTMIRLEPSIVELTTVLDRWILAALNELDWQTIGFKAGDAEIITFFRALGMDHSEYFNFSTGEPIGTDLMDALIEVEYGDGDEDISEGYYQSILQFLRTPISPEEILDIRAEVYFSHSLVSRLIQNLN